MEKQKQQLSAAEQRRCEMLEKTTAELKQQGYTRHDLLISMTKANIFSFVLLILLSFGGLGLYYLINRRFDNHHFNLFTFLITVIVLSIVHELIHGLSWSLFTPHHFHDIEFGIMKPSFAPYCTCLVPLKKQQHLFATAMPFFVLGILPMIIGIIIADPDILFMGIIMSAAAAGDILIILKMLTYKTASKDLIYIDHPTGAGCVVFER